MNDTPPDCCADDEQKMLSVEEGRRRILDAVPVIRTSEQIELRAALHRVLARAVAAGIDVPPFDNSAMDGYAVRSQDCAERQPAALTIVGAAFAGAPFDGELSPGQCVRIMTGAVMPKGADAVLMQEHVSREGDRIRLQGGKVHGGQNVRYAGEDLRRGDIVLQRGLRLGPAELGLLASVGISEIHVTRKLRVALLSTGDELVGTGTPLQRGQIYDSNRYTLFGLLSRPEIECHDLGTIPDRRDAVREAFGRTGELADVVLTSGGVSVGEADYVKETLEELGEIGFWRMAMKPGKPLAFGRLGKATFFGLPGNPVSVMATFYQFVLPAIRRMTGQLEREPFVIQARCSESLSKASGRMEFQRGILRRDAEGQWVVGPTGVQGSHVLSSMSRANCFILLSTQSTGAKKGDVVRVQPSLDFCC
jgi:molybdopterin molybdotransferase